MIALHHQSRHVNGIGFILYLLAVFWAANESLAVRKQPMCYTTLQRTDTVRVHGSIVAIDAKSVIESGSAHMIAGTPTASER